MSENGAKEEIGVYMPEEVRPGTPTQVLDEIRERGGYTIHDSSGKTTSFLRLPWLDKLFQRVFQRPLDQEPSKNPSNPE